MIKFSWYTIPVKLSDLSTVYQYAVDRFIPLEVDRHGFGSYIHVKAGTFVTRHDGGWQRYKPNMKGGHRHNHVRNARFRGNVCPYCDGIITKGYGERRYDGVLFCTECAQADYEGRCDRAEYLSHIYG